MDHRRLVTKTRLHPLEKRIYLLLKERRSLWEERKVLAGVSGGVDSMALLYVLTKLQSRLKFKLEVVHVNHRTRSLENDEEALFVENTSKSLEVKFHCEGLAAQVGSRASEDELREKRYKVFQKYFRQTRAQALFLAHHWDDQLETRIMRLLQGTGLKGLQGMEFESEVFEMRVIRPFLAVSKAALQSYCLEENFDFREDSSNENESYFRNWVRRTLLPTIARRDTAFIQNLGKSLERIVESSLEITAGMQEAHGNERILDRQDLSRGSKARRRIEAHRFLRANTAARLTESHVDEFLKHLSRTQNKFKFRLAGQDWQVWGPFVSTEKKSVNS